MSNDEDEPGVTLGAASGSRAPEPSAADASSELTLLEGDTDDEYEEVFPEGTNPPPRPRSMAPRSSDIPEVLAAVLGVPEEPAPDGRSPSDAAPGAALFRKPADTAGLPPVLSALGADEVPAVFGVLDARAVPAAVAPEDVAPDPETGAHAGDDAEPHDPRADDGADDDGAGTHDAETEDAPEAPADGVAEDCVAEDCVVPHDPAEDDAAPDDDTRAIFAAAPSLPPLAATQPEVIGAVLGGLTDFDRPGALGPSARARSEQPASYKSEVEALSAEALLANTGARAPGAGRPPPLPSLPPLSIRAAPSIGAPAKAPSERAPLFAPAPAPTPLPPLDEVLRGPLRFVAVTPREPRLSENPSWPAGVPRPRRRARPRVPWLFVAAGLTGLGAAATLLVLLLGGEPSDPPTATADAPATDAPAAEASARDEPPVAALPSAPLSKPSSSAGAPGAVEHARPPAPATPANQGTAAPAPPTVAGAVTSPRHASPRLDCRPERPGRRLARNVSARVPLEADAAPGGAVLLGYVEGSGSARGLLIDSETLRVRRVLESSTLREVDGVVPHSDGFEPRFVVDGAPGPGEGTTWRTLPGRSGFSLARSAGNVQLVAHGLDRTTPLWPLSDATEATRPVLWRADAYRYALAFRAGVGDAAVIRYGWLDVPSAQRSRLESLSIGAAEVGVPSVALAGERMLIATAVRYRASSPYELELWRIDGERAPARVLLSALPRTQDEDRIAPRLAALPGGSFALQWTAGTLGKRRVELLVLDPSLKPVREPQRITSERQSGGAGLLVASEERLLSFYLVQVHSRWDLWLQVLTCGDSGPAPSEAR